MSTSNTNPRKVVTGVVRFSYLHIWKPSTINEGDTPKYSATLIIPKSDKATVDAINHVIQLAKEEGKSKWGGKIPAKMDSPLRDGDEERPDDPAYANAYFINPKSTTQPGIVDAKAQPIMDQDEIYSGAYGRASITAYPYDAKGNKGVAFYLNNIMKVKDGEPLGGAKSKPEDDFAAYVGEEVDDMLA